MNVENLRSPYIQCGGIYYFPRMLDKIRLHAAGQLPADYQENLGVGFDERCSTFLRIDYASLVERVKQGGTDEEVLEWVFTKGRRTTEEDIEIWNEFMRKRGWNDEATERLIMRKGESNIPNRDDIQTLFDYIDFDEGRDPKSRA